MTLLASGLGLTALPAHAQQSNEPLEEIIILEAPLAVRYPDGRSASGVPYEVVELTRRVSYADLDLRRDSDVDTLENRIEVTATDSCQQLAEMFPLDISSDETRTCVKQAISGAMEQADTAIAMASAPSSEAGEAMRAAARAANAAERAAQAAKQAAAAARQAANEARAARKRTDNMGE